MTLSEALERVLERSVEEEVRPDTLNFYRWQLGYWIKALGPDGRLDRLTREDVQRLVNEARREGTSPTTIRHRLSVLTRACNVCGVEPNPADRNKLSLPRSRKRDPSLRMSWEDVVAVLLALREADQYETMAVLGFVAGTGIRRTEFARMRNIDLDLSAGRVVIAFGKNEPRTLPAPKKGTGMRTVAETLLGLEPLSEFVLPGDTERRRIEYLRGHVKLGRHIAEEPRLQLHELRRCFGSRVAESFPVPVAAALLGNTLEGVVGRYVSADWKTLAEAMTEVWSDFEE